MTKTNNNLNIFQDSLTTTQITSGLLNPFGKYYETTMLVSSQTLSTTAEQLSDMTIQLPLQGTYEITANIVEDLSEITQSTPNFSSYQLYLGTLGDFSSNGTFSSSTESKVTFCSSDGSTFAVVNDNKIYISRNNGATWQQPATVSTTAYDIVGSYDGQKIYIALFDSNTLYYSSDYGSTWNFTSCGGRRLCCSYDGSIVYSTNGLNGVNKSIDSGVTWTATGSSAQYMSSVCCSDDGQKVLAYNYYPSSNLYISTNGGTSWSIQSSPYNWGFDFLKCDSTCTKIAACASFRSAGGGGYINVSNDSGATWDFGVNGIIAQWVDLSVSRDGNLIHAATQSEQAIYRSTDGGSNFYILTELGLRSRQSMGVSDNGNTIVDCSAITIYSDYNIFVHIKMLQKTPVENTKIRVNQISTLTSAITGVNAEMKNIKWVYESSIGNTTVNLFCKKENPTTGYWKVKSDSNGRTTMFARLIS